MIAKAKHKELKKQVNEVEEVRNNDRSSTSWFQLRELKKLKLKEKKTSQTATRHGINNNPSEDHMNNLKALCENVLQKVRDHYGKVVSISSGYRSPELCVKIGSSVNSQHAKGEAADFEVFGLSNAELCKYIANNLEFDQLILEYHNIDEPNSGWVHC